jgi:hypothetical protein
MTGQLWPESVAARVRMAQAFYNAAATELVFKRFMGPPSPPLPWWRRRLNRLSWRWYDLRVWIAVHVLRVDIGDD